MNDQRRLTFSTLDGLAFAAERDRLSGIPLISSDGAIGPILEWMHLSGTGLLPAPENVAWLSLGTTAPMVAAMRSDRKKWVCPVTRATGFIRLSPTCPENDGRWVSFGL